MNPLQWIRRQMSITYVNKTSKTSAIESATFGNFKKNWDIIFENENYYAVFQSTLRNCVPFTFWGKHQTCKRHEIIQGKCKKLEEC